MNRRTILGTALLVVMGTTLVAGEVLDRIIAVVNDVFIITLSDVRRERTIQTALGKAPGDDNSIVDNLVEQRLIEEEIAQFRMIDIDPNDVEQKVRELGSPDGVSREELRSAVAGEFRRIEFKVQRFGQFIRVSDEDLRRYFDEVFAPELRRNGMPVPPLEQGLSQARPHFVAERMEQEASLWISELLRRSNIEKISK